MQTLEESYFKEFLEDVQLYVWREFKKPIMIEGIWIKEVDGFCNKCRTTKPFQPLNPSGGPRGVQIPMATWVYLLEFTCVSCGIDTLRYNIEQIDTGTTLRIQKFGQLPKMKLAANRDLSTFLKDDLGNYEKALACLSHEFGVGAFAYFRRIVEKNIIRLVDLLQEDIRISGVETEVTAELAKLRKRSPMKHKIEIANRALPDYLKPHGKNPLGRLYSVLSEGIHNLSEEACLAKANAISNCLEYLVSELASRNQLRAQFNRTVDDI